MNALRDASEAGCVQRRFDPPSGAKDLATLDNPERHAVVTHVSGTFCYLCVRVGHRFALPGGGGIEHATHRHAINACRGDSKADDATGEDVHDQQHPMAAQDDRFNAEQIDAPDTIFCLSDKGQPGWTML